MMDHCPLCASKQLPPNTLRFPSTLAGFKRIPPFCGPLVEVKEAVIMIDRPTMLLDLLNGTHVCAVCHEPLQFVN